MNPVTPLEQIGGYKPPSPCKLSYLFEPRGDAVRIRNTDEVECHIAIQSRGKISPGTNPFKKKYDNTSSLSLFAASKEHNYDLVLTRVKCAEHNTTMVHELEKRIVGLRRYNMVTIWDVPALDAQKRKIATSNWDEKTGMVLNGIKMCWPFAPDQNDELTMMENLSKLDPKISHEFQFVRSAGDAPNGMSETVNDMYYTGDSFYTRVYCDVNLNKLGWKFVRNEGDPYWKMPASIIASSYENSIDRVLDVIEQAVFSNCKDGNFRWMYEYRDNGDATLIDRDTIRAPIAGTYRGPAPMEPATSDEAAPKKAAKRARRLEFDEQND